MRPAMLHPLLLLLLLPSLLATLCPPHTAPLFLLPEGLAPSESTQKCVEVCGSENCTGVLLEDGRCTAFRIEDFTGDLDEARVLRKHCVQGFDELAVISYRPQRVIPSSTTQRIAPATDKFHCLALCAREKTFPCHSVMYYESGDCLIDAADSSTHEVTANTEGFNVVYMESIDKPDSSLCESSAFQLVSLPAARALRGEAVMSNGTGGLQQCVSRCADGCDYAMFNEAYSECVSLRESASGQQMHFIDGDWTVRRNLCHYRKPDSCTARNSLYIAAASFPNGVQKECLRVCMSSPTCRFAYLSSSSSSSSSPCRASDRPLQLPQVIERKCTGLHNMDYGLLFEQSSCRVAASSKGVLAVDGVPRDECLNMCVTHPTKSCEAVSHQRDGNKCIMFDGPLERLVASNESCSFFSLNIVSFEQIEGKGKDKVRGYSKKRSGKKKATEEMARARGQKTVDVKSSELDLLQRDLQIELAHIQDELGNLTTPMSTKIEKSGEQKNVEQPLIIRPVCLFHQIRIKVSSPNSLSGRIFTRNHLETCSSTIEGKEGQLDIDIQDEEKLDACGIVKTGNTYRAVIVVKPDEEDTPQSFITQQDQFYHVTCDYGNATTTTAKAALRQLSDMPYNSFSLRVQKPGSEKEQNEEKHKATLEKIRANDKRMDEMEGVRRGKEKREETVMKMRLREGEEAKKVETVSIGQPMQLYFNAPADYKYNIKDCTAFNNDASENLTIIENGCALAGVRDWIIPAPIQFSKDGFSIPFRAFRFQKGEGVRIQCRLADCDKGCKKPACEDLLTKRLRRTVEESANETSVQADMLVTNNKVASPVCVSRWMFSSACVLFALLILSQIAGIVHICTRKKSGDSVFW